MSFKTQISLGLKNVLILFFQNLHLFFTYTGLTINSKDSASKTTSMFKELYEYESSVINQSNLCELPQTLQIIF